MRVRMHSPPTHWARFPNLTLPSVFSCIDTTKVPSASFLFLPLPSSAPSIFLYLAFPSSALLFLPLPCSSFLYLLSSAVIVLARPLIAMTPSSGWPVCTNSGIALTSSTQSQPRYCALLERRLVIACGGIQAPGQRRGGTIDKGTQGTPCRKKERTNSTSMCWMRILRSSYLSCRSSARMHLASNTT